MFPPKGLLAPLCLTLALVAAARAADARPAEAAPRPADTCAAPAAKTAPGPAVSRPCSVPAETAPCPTSAAPADTCRTAPARTAPAPKARRLDAGDPFVAAALGVLPLASGFYVSSSPVKGAAFTLADIMLIGAIVQVRSDPNHSPKDAVTYYWLLAGVNLADAVLSVMQAQSDAAKRLSVNINPSDRPGFLLGWRF